MTFEQQFTQGIEYRSQFDSNFSLNKKAQQLLERTFVQTREKAMNEPFFSIRQGVCSMAQTYAADNSVEPFAYQCLADSHTFLNACLAQKILDEKYMALTIGDVSFDGKKLFDVSRKTLKASIRDGISTVDKPKFHVWLTLVDMTVIDLTIVRYLLSQQRISPPQQPSQWLNVWRPERRGRFDYHPVLIDDDFLSRMRRPSH